MKDSKYTMIKKLLQLMIMYFLCLASYAKGDVIVVVNAMESFDTLSQEQVRYIFLGRPVNISGHNKPLKPVDCEDPTLREDFYRAIANKSLRQMNSYWARYLFSGKASPPEKIDCQKVIEMISTEPGHIGYIKELPEELSKLKVVFRKIE